MREKTSPVKQQAEQCGRYDIYSFKTYLKEERNLLFSTVCMLAFLERW